MSLGEILDGSDLREIGPRAPREISLPLPPLPPMEPLFWALFSAGGMVAAFLLPAHVAVLGIAHAAGWLPDDALSYERILDLVRHPLTKLYLWGLVALPLYHWAHRFRFAIHHQFGIHGWKRLITTLCYGTAIVGTALTALVLLRI